MSLDAKLTALATAMGTDVKNINLLIGQLSDLGWETEPASVAAALVVLSDANDDVVSKMGDLAGLTTTAKSNLVAAINEVKALAESGGGGDAVIDDNAGIGDTTKVWSADKQAKVLEALRGKAFEIEPYPYLVLQTGTDLELYDPVVNPDAYTFVFGETSNGWNFSAASGAFGAKVMRGVAIQVTGFPTQQTLRWAFNSVSYSATSQTVSSVGIADASAPRQETGSSSGGSPALTTDLNSEQDTAYLLSDANATKMLSFNLTPTINIGSGDPADNVDVFAIKDAYYPNLFTLARTLGNVQADVFQMSGDVEEVFNRTDALSTALEAHDIVAVDDLLTGSSLVYEAGTPAAFLAAFGAGTFTKTIKEGSLGTDFSLNVYNSNPDRVGYLRAALAQVDDPDNGPALVLERLYSVDQGGGSGALYHRYDVQVEDTVVPGAWKQLGGDGTILDYCYIDGQQTIPYINSRLAGLQAQIDDTLTAYYLNKEADKAPESLVIAGVDDAKFTTSKGVAAAIAAQLAALIDAAPSTLDTLNEIAEALGNDPNFATTMATALGFRVRFDAAQTLTTPQKLQACTNIGVGDPDVDLVAAYNAAKA